MLGFPVHGREHPLARIRRLSARAWGTATVTWASGKDDWKTLTTALGFPASPQARRLTWSADQDSTSKATLTPTEAAQNPASPMFNNFRGATGLSGNAGSATTDGPTKSATWRCSASRLPRLALASSTRGLRVLTSRSRRARAVRCATRSPRNYSIPDDNSANSCNSSRERRLVAKRILVAAKSWHNCS